MSGRIKSRKCKNPECGVMYEPISTFSRACTYQCALILVEIQKDKLRRKRLREGRKALKTLGDWTKEAQSMFNKYIRARDKDLPCISCQRHHDGQYHAGHYMTTSTRPELRFNEDNCSKQCSPCNTHLSGNLIEYRINLVEKIGLDKVVELEGRHEPKNYSIQDVREIREKYRKKVKELKRKS